MQLNMMKMIFLKGPFMEVVELIFILSILIHKRQQKDLIESW